VFYNFAYFDQFWKGLPGNVRPRSVRQWLQCDGAPWWKNTGHLAAFVGIAIILGLSGAGPAGALVLASLLNLIHEYVIEGWFVDPSCLDLWVDQIGACMGAAVVGLVDWRRRQAAVAGELGTLSDV